MVSAAPPAEGAAAADMAVDAARRKRAAEVPLEEVPEALERGDLQPDQPADMEDLAQAPAVEYGPMRRPQEGVDVVWNASRGRYQHALSLDAASLEVVEDKGLTAAKAKLYGLVREQVEDHWVSMDIPITLEEVKGIALKALQIGAVDLAELYSLHRYSARAAEFQLRPGFAVGLEELMEESSARVSDRPTSRT